MSQSAPAHSASSAARSRRTRREANPLFRREMRERWRRPLTMLQLAVFAGVLAWLAYNFYGSSVPQGEVSSDMLRAGTGRDFFFSVALTHIMVWLPGGFLLSAPALSAERERGHISEWLLAGLSPMLIVRAKFSALAGFVLVMVCVPFPVLALCFPLGGVSPFDFLVVGALTLVLALNSMAAGLFISAQSPSVARALGFALVGGAVALVLGVGVLLPSIESRVWLLFIAIFLAPMPWVWREWACGAFAEAIINDLNAPPTQPARARPPEPVKSPLELRATELSARQQSAVVALSETRVVSRRDGPPSSWEAALLSASDWNALTRRDLWAALQTRRESLYWLAYFHDLRGLLGFWGVAGALAIAARGLMPDAPWFAMGAALWGALVMAQAALSAAPGFTRERAQRMLSALQMTALSPLDIVAGKVAGVLLSCAANYAGPLLMLCLLALSYGPRSAAMAAFAGVCCVLMTATGSLTLSLWSRRTEIVALGALAAVAALWGVAPYIYANYTDVFRAPNWLWALWLSPLRALGGAQSDAQLALALGQIGVLCALATLVLGALCARELKRTRAEEEATGWMQRDLSRGWH